MALYSGFIDGSQVTGEMLRRALYASTGGNTGISRPGDLKVTAQTTPGSTIRVARGGGVIATSFSDADPGQSYAVSNTASTSIAVPANTGTVTKTWHVIYKVRDPQYQGEVIPSNPATDSYGDLLVVDTLPSARPYLYLAQLKVPGQTATITNAMITDKRQLAQPRTERILKARAINTDDTQTLTESNPAANFKDFPASEDFEMYVPEWVRQFRVVVTYYNFKIVTPGTNRSAFTVDMKLPSGANLKTLNPGYSNVSSNDTGTNRTTTGLADTFTIPAEWRGQTIRVIPRGRKVSGNRNVTLDTSSAYTIDIEMVEAPDADEY